MAYYPKDRNVNGVFYHGAAGSDQVFESNSTFTYNIADNVVDVHSTGATTAFFDNQASIATSDDTDLLLLLTGTATSNPGYRKITKANFSAALGGGTMSSWDLDGDTGSTQTVENAESVTIAGGTGLSSVVNATNVITVNISGIQSDMIVDGSIANVDLANSTISAAADNGSNQAISLGGTLTIAGGTGIETTTSVGSDTVTINQVVTVNSGTLTAGSDLPNDVNVIDVTAGSASYSLPLNPPVGRVVRVKKGDSSANTVTITGAAGKPIDNATAGYILYNQWESATFICDANGWYVF